jgi:hypothetical protein
MHVDILVMPAVALLFGILILMLPRLLNTWSRSTGS